MATDLHFPTVYCVFTYSRNTTFLNVQTVHLLHMASYPVESMVLVVKNLLKIILQASIRKIRNFKEMVDRYRGLE